MRRMAVLALLYLTGISGLVFAQTSPVASPLTPERSQIETFLRHWNANHLVTDTELAPIKAMGKKALPILATYLSDKELGYLAESAMVQIDPVAATPYLLKNLTAKDPNIQRDTFRLANRQMMEYEWYERQGKPKADPNLPSPRYPSATTPYPYREAIHAAALTRLATMESAVGAENEAILTIGLTGSKKDIPVLRKYLTLNDGRYHTVVIAALARLGDTSAIKTISAELAKPVLPHPAEPFYRDNGSKHESDPGAVVVSREEGIRVRDAAFQAGFTMDRRFVPLLLSHLSDPPGQFHGDYADPSPAQEAMNALSKILHGKEYADPARKSPADWTNANQKP